MAEPDPLSPLLRDLLVSQRLAVLATDQRGRPHTSLVAFAADDRLGEVIFATPRATRKYENLKTNPRVSLLIDSRTNQPADFREAVAVTVGGEATELAGPAREAAVAAFVARHPHLLAFVSGPDCALFSVRVDDHSLASRFQ